MAKHCSRTIFWWFVLDFFRLGVFAKKEHCSWRDKKLQVILNNPLLEETLGKITED